MTAEYDKRKVAEQPQFYGRRRGRKLRPAQELALHQGMEEYALPSAELKASSLDPRQWFPQNCKQMCLEIGFGGGEHLAARASQNPDHGYIGAEPFVNGVASLCRHIKEQHLENIRIWNDDVRLLLPHLASSSLDAVYILFPDPWPKSRHAARRILQPEMLEMLSDKMRVGAEL
ncbi:MAG: tRNA (guanosine(46)-N7)-methyltransferase TrmB, partial [Alphaproteobacteria bacterium]|nr:tRNA (guanosine(46)-N7)-methyltransferase TrmB [Alphaproteobacteria bacterium]